MTKEELLQSVSAGNITESIASNGIFDAVNLSEDVKGSLVTVIDRAVKSLVEQNTATMAEALLAANAEAIDEAVTVQVQKESEAMVEALDAFCESVADKYLDENAEAIENNIKVDMFESLLDGLKNLFFNNNISIEEDKIDVVNELMDEIQESKETVKFLTSAYKSTKDQLVEMKRENIIVSKTKGLTENQKQTVKEVVIGSEFDEKTFGSIVESVVDLVKNNIDETSLNEGLDPDQSDLEGLNYIPENTVNESKSTKPSTADMYNTIL